MSYKEITLKSQNPSAAFTEIMFEIATARVDSVDLLRINIFEENDIDDSLEQKRFISIIIKYVKSLKQNGVFQFYATADSFRQLTTEAVFLQNKYPEIFSVDKNLEGVFIYIKI